MRGRIGIGAFARSLACGLAFACGLMGAAGLTAGRATAFFLAGLFLAAPFLACCAAFTAALFRTVFRAAFFASRAAALVFATFFVPAFALALRAAGAALCVFAFTLPLFAAFIGLRFLVFLPFAMICRCSEIVSAAWDANETAPMRQARRDNGRRRGRLLPTGKRLQGLP
ncbi:MAG: hypothetical protein J0H26_09870 [Alphaproteobacteria bacterium]|nr:hypothetical protein [Alphaproteobacteria bacterium]